MRSFIRYRKPVKNPLSSGQNIFAAAVAAKIRDVKIQDLRDDPVSLGFP
jgi:hypothetical protein